MKQTAVEWLQDKIKETYNQEGKLPLAYTLDLVRQAKAMDKEQKIEAWYNGAINGAGLFEINTGEQYYNETFGQGGNDTTSQNK